MEIYTYILNTVLLLTVFLLIYPILIYPGVISVISSFYKRRINTKKEYEPEISVLIAAYNEEELIEGCIRSVMNSDYPIEKLNVFVGSDGSDDDTNAIVAKLSSEFTNLKLIEFPRSGKNKVLNQLVPHAQGSVYYFMDADVKIKKDTIKRLNEYLSDPEIGAAVSALNIISDGIINNAGTHGETVYQKYESMLRVNESSIESNINSLGAFYGVKAENFKPFPSDKVCDDLFNVFAVILDKKRVIFDNSIVVDEVRTKSIGQEFNRKVRVVSGGLSTVSASAELLTPKYGWSAFFLWSHKILRWMSPIFLILLFILTFPVPVDSNIRIVLLYLQIIAYGSALTGYLLDKLDVSIPYFRLAYFYVSMNVAFLMGIFRFLSGKQNSSWNRDGLDD